MGLQSKIEDDFKNALKTRDREVISVLRMLKAAIANREIALKKKDSGLFEEEITEAVQSEAKKRKDAEEQYRKGGREDLAEKERGERAILARYMPEQLSAEEIQKIAQDVIREIGARGVQDSGKVMGNIMPRLKGRADGEVVSRIVKELLSNDEES